MTWTDKAQCKGLDTEMFFEPDRDEFPDRTSWQQATQNKLKDARKMCQGCPVINDCLRENLTTPFGIFGGMSTLQRQKIARKHGLSVSDDTLRNETTPMDASRVKLIIDLYRKNHSIADISSLTGINRFTVSKVVNNQGNYGPDGEKKPAKDGYRGKRLQNHGYRFQKSWADPKYAPIREMLAQGHGAKHIGRETGSCWKLVQRIRYSMQQVQEEMELAK